MAAASGGKDVIYVDIDDEITSIIDKVGRSKNKVVALVLPKRATVLQSIVNMKLLKRSADENNKNLVLVTNEAGLMPLAGAVGLHVAATPQSKPVIPRKPGDMGEDETENVDEDEAEHYDFSPKAAGATAVGALAGMAGEEPIDDEIQLDNEDTPPATGKGAAAVAAGTKTGKAAKGKDKKLKVPDFNKFRLRLILGILALIALIVVFVFANVVLPKASVAIQTDSQDIHKNLDVTLDTKAQSLDTDNNVLPAVAAQDQKTTTQSVEASGQQNNGQRAEGSIQMSICASGQKDVKDIPAGTGVTTDGKVFITQERTQFQPSQFCNGGFEYVSKKVDIVAQQGGTQYNVNDANFTVTGSSATATGSADGGTDAIVKIVQQSDIDSAKQKLASQVDNSVKGELAQKLEDQNLYVISDSFNTGTPEVTASAKAGDQVESVTVTQKTTYSLMGVKQNDLEQLMTDSVKDEIDETKQRVLNTGLDKAVFKLQGQVTDPAKLAMTLDFTALAGPKLDDNALKDQIAGKKAADAESLIKSYPGVTDVNVSYSPFWVSSIPKKTSKITITYVK